MPRVSDGLFRRDMLGPSFMNLVTSITGLLLIEKLILDFILPSWIPSIEAFEVFMGKWPAVCIIATINSVVSFWGFGLIFALPALFKVKSWKIQANKDLDFKLLLDSLPLIAFNFVLQVLVGLPIMIYGLPESSYDWRALPSTDVLARDVIIWLLVEEVCFFYVHKWLHENKKMYASVHKIHHTWTSPVSFVAIYCHPFEHLLSNVTPVLLGPILCSSHAAALAVFLAVGTIHTLIVHSWILVLWWQWYAWWASCQIQCEFWCHGPNGQPVWYVSTTSRCPQTKVGHLGTASKKVRSGPETLR